MINFQKYKVYQINSTNFFSAYKLYRLYAEKVHSRLIFLGESVGFFYAKRRWHSLTDEELNTALYEVQ